MPSCRRFNKRREHPAPVQSVSTKLLGSMVEQKNCALLTHIKLTSYDLSVTHHVFSHQVSFSLWLAACVSMLQRVSSVLELVLCFLWCLHWYCVLFGDYGVKDSFVWQFWIPFIKSCKNSYSLTKNATCRNTLLRDMWITKKKMDDYEKLK